jgi:hypothetical protein
VSTAKVAVKGRIKVHSRCSVVQFCCFFISIMYTSCHRRRTTVVYLARDLFHFILSLRFILVLHIQKKQ